MKINTISKKDLKMLEGIDKDCLKMHLCPPPKTFINMKVHEGRKLVLDYDMMSKSWVRNAYNYLVQNIMGLSSGSGGATFGAGTLSIKNVSNTIIRSTSGYIQCLGDYNTWSQDIRCIGAVGVDTQGIVIGIGITAESFEEYALNTKILHGITSGKITYNAEAVCSFAYDSVTKKVTGTSVRVFNNNSGAEIIVTEVGRIFNTAWGYSGGNALILMCRDLLASSVAVPNGAQLTVTYTMEMTYPA